MTDTLALPARATLGDVEETWSDFVSTTGENPAVIDLTECNFLEVPVLVYLTARLKALSNLGASPTLRLPRSQRVRSVLKTWHFAEAVDDALDVGLDQLIDDEEAQEYRTTASDPNQLLPRNFFPIRSFFARGGPFGSSLAFEESARWQQRYILSVLERYLKGDSRRVSTHIVYEAIMNAVRHPRAGILQTCSHLSKGGNSLTIVIWDSGESMVSTLRRRIEEVETLTSVPDERFRSKFSLRVKDAGTNETVLNERISSDLILDAGTADAILLISALFPGVTSKATGGEAHQAVVAEDEAFGLPGMGLFVLANSVVDVFGGNVALRTSRLFASVKSENGKETPLCYRAKVIDYGAADEFCGNMLTIRIPTSNAKPVQQH